MTVKFHALVLSLTALDLAMIGGHWDVANYLISQGAPSGGGKFHRSAATIQAVWRLYKHRVSVHVHVYVQVCLHFHVIL